MATFELQTLSRDEDGQLELRVTLTGNGLVGAHTAYVYPDELNAFGAALQSYPFSVSREAVLEVGSQDPEWYGYMKLRVFLLSGFGRSAMEMQFDTRGELPDRASAIFYVAGDPASFSRLGEEICRFASADAQWLRHEWRDA